MQQLSENQATKRTYEAPELVEHGTIEEITGGGYDDSTYGCSGKTYKYPV